MIQPIASCEVHQWNKLNHDISLSIRPLFSLLLECVNFDGANVIIA